MPNKYPDISDILDAKQRSRGETAKLSFGEKIELVEKLRADLAPFKRAREERRAGKDEGSTQS